MAEAEDVTSDLNNLAMSEAAVPLLDAVKKHIAENVAPISEEFFKLAEGLEDRWSYHPRQLELLDARVTSVDATISPHIGPNNTSIFSRSCPIVQASSK